MLRKLFCFVVALSLRSTSATSRSLAVPPNDGFGVHHHQQQGYSPQSMRVSMGPVSSSKEIPFQSFKSREGKRGGITKEAYFEGENKLGSSPPICEQKCHGCNPCVATQVPAKTKRSSHLGLEYANYEPESWKCKCGPFFYSP